SHMRRSPADPESALKELDKAVHLNDSYLEAYNERGHVRNALRDFEGSIADYTKAIELKPDNARLYVNRATIQIRKPMPDLDAALQDLEEAVRLDGTMAEAYSTRGNLWCARKEFPKAIADYDRAIELNPNNPAFYKNRGMAYRQLGKTELSDKDFARVKE